MAADSGTAGSATEEAAARAAAGSLAEHDAGVAGQLGRAGVALRRRVYRLAASGKLSGSTATAGSCRRLAERYDCDDETVRPALNRAGVNLRKASERG